MASSLQDIADVADELTDPHPHLEKIYTTTTSRHRRLTHLHKTVQPGLLTQVRDAVLPAATQDADGHRGIPRSRPPLQLEALSLLVVIEIGAARWCWSVHLDQRDTAESNIRALVGAAATLDSDTQAALLDELRRWRTWCAVMTGWQSPLYQPHAPCPHCDQRGTLRVNLARQSAFCTTKTWSPERGEHLWCATWNPATIGVLADHIRATTDRTVERTP